ACAGRNQAAMHAESRPPDNSNRSVTSQAFRHSNRHPHRSPCRTVDSRSQVAVVLCTGSDQHLHALELWRSGVADDRQSVACRPTNLENRSWVRVIQQREKRVGRFQALNVFPRDLGTARAYIVKRREYARADSAERPVHEFHKPTLTEIEERARQIHASVAWSELLIRPIPKGRGRKVKHKCLNPG